MYELIGKIKACTEASIYSNYASNSTDYFKYVTSDYKKFCEFNEMLRLNGLEHIYKYTDLYNVVYEQSEAYKEVMKVIFPESLSADEADKRAAVITTLHNYKSYVYLYDESILLKAFNKSSSDIVCSNLIMLSSYADMDTFSKRNFLYEYHSNRNISGFSPEQRRALLLSNIKTVGGDANILLEYLSKDDSLIYIENFLYHHQFDYGNIAEILFRIPDPKRFMNLTCKMFLRLKELNKEKANNNLEQILEILLLENFQDLELAYKFVKDSSLNRIEEVILTELGFISTIHKHTRLYKHLSMNSRYHRTWTEIVIYAIRFRKKRFINTLQDINLCNPAPELFRNEIFYKHVNINTLSLSDINSLNSIDTSSRMLPKIITREGLYTLKEFKTLVECRNTNSNLVTLYHVLSMFKKIDVSILRTQQLIKIFRKSDVAKDIMNFDKLTNQIIEMSIYDWKNQLFGNKQISIYHVLRCLEYVEDYRNIIEELNNDVDVDFFLNNVNQFQLNQIETYSEMKRIFLSKDDHIKRFVDWLGINEEIQKTEHFKNFCVKGGAKLCMDYLAKLSEFDEGIYAAKFKKIVAAEVHEKMDILKYPEGDIQIELNMLVSENTMCSWIQNSSYRGGSYQVIEDDSFLGTMRIGEYPCNTSLSYIDGSHAECLISNFDSNKKILYILQDGRIVGRAILRFTKMRYRHGEDFDFIDVENATTEKKQFLLEEHMILFVERLYTKHLSKHEIRDLVSQMSELVGTKAKQMNVAVVFSRDYAKYLPPDLFKQEVVDVYITRSKSKQYLDSVGFENTNMEGGYYTSIYFIKKDMEKQL